MEQLLILLEDEIHESTLQLNFHLCSQKFCDLFKRGPVAIRQSTPLRQWLFSRNLHTVFYTLSESSRHCWKIIGTSLNLILYKISCFHISFFFFANKSSISMISLLLFPFLYAIARSRKITTCCSLMRRYFLFLIFNFYYPKNREKLFPLFKNKRNLIFIQTNGLII